MFSTTLAFASRTRPLNVVVADDVVEIQELVQHWLKDVGCAVSCASCGREVVKLMREKQIDVVITDVIMPDGDGLEVICDVKRLQPEARVLAISGGGSHLQAKDVCGLRRDSGRTGCSSSRSTANSFWMR